VSSRLPQLTPEHLNDAQRALYDGLVGSFGPWADQSGFEVIAPDGSLLGPLNPPLFSPALGTALVGLFHADRANTSLSPRVHEVVILTVGAAWRSEYELEVHRAVGKRAGLSADVIDALVAGGQPDFHNDQEAVAHDFTRQLVGRHRVTADTYARAEQAFGHKGLVDMVILVGLYLATCSLINAFDSAGAADGADPAGPATSPSPP
jgi:4-carboxymuconolactone decarboxylase